MATTWAIFKEMFPLIYICVKREKRPKKEMVLLTLTTMCFKVIHLKQNIPTECNVY